MDYKQVVRDSLLPLSVGGTLPVAFAEWSFTGITHDHEQATEICDLCGKRDLRYHFQIANGLTGAELWVGSHCILQFELPVFDGDRQIAPAEARAHLQAHVRRMQIEYCIKALSILADREDSNILRGALDYYARKNKLTPRYADVVFWRLQRHRIEHQPSFFAIELRERRHIDALRDLPTKRVHRLWGALTSAQRRKAVELGHPAPRQG
ncbi:MAG: hypothetical protein KYX69_22005 [Sphingomonas sp.]|uniref:hypothetical protein n=1 Tax=Sphingomonas sp. TaxID=28214 RepID=UPI002614B76F|nr:hypothetical protein [Sphingomonas sp.]MDK2770383.1 hypothetical protein [Sphingomonas sp.]